MARPLLLAGWAAGACIAGIEVSIDPSGRIELQATSAPLSAVLECLAAPTGMKVVYDAPVNQRVTVSLTNQTIAEVVVRLLEGLGINYAIGFDPAGTRVKTLLISGAAAAAGTPRPEPTPHPNPPAAISPSPPEENPLLTPNPGEVPSEAFPQPPGPAFPGAGQLTPPLGPSPDSPGSVFPVAPPTPLPGTSLVPLVPFFPEARPLTLSVMRRPL